MEYNKIIFNNKNIHVINTSRFKTISFSLFLYRNYNKNDIEYLSLLTKILLHNTKKYNTKNKFIEKSEDLYNAEVVSKVSSVSNIEMLIITLSFINPKHTEEIMYKESLKLFNEILFNPNVIDNAFNEESFLYNKKQLIDTIRMLEEKPSSLAYENFKELMYKSYPLGNKTLGKKENYEKITRKNLYKFYESLFDSFNVSASVVGEDINDMLLDEVKKVLEKFNYKKMDFNFYLKEKEINVCNITDEIDASQSHLIMGYQFNDLTYKERKYILVLYNAILGSMSNNILFNTVREKYSLCYTVKSVFISYPSSINIICSINKCNLKKAKDAINESLDAMKKEDVVSSLLESAKKAINIYINNIYDDPVSLSSFYMERELTYNDDLEKRREIFDSISVSDILMLNKKMKKKVTYFLEGGL